MLTKAAHGTDGNNPFNAKALECPDIGAYRNLGGVNAVPSPMAWQKCHRHTLHLAYSDSIAGVSKGRLHGDLFNIGSTERVSIDELAQRVLAATASSSEIVHIPYDEVYGQGIDDMLHRQPSIEKVNAAVGWSPSRSLDEILADVIAHIRRAPVFDESVA